MRTAIPPRTYSTSLRLMRYFGRFLIATCIWNTVELALAVRLVTQTVDDMGGDSQSTLTYLPQDQWGQGQNCPTCLVKPDPGSTHGGTWHDTTASDSLERSIVFTFYGTALNVFCIIANTVPATDETASHFTFLMDGQPAGRYDHTPSSTAPEYEYNVPVYQNPNLSNGSHTFTLQAGGQGTGSSLVLFDYLTYTQSFEESTPPSSPNPPSSPDSPSSPGSPSSSPSSPSSSPGSASPSNGAPLNNAGASGHASGTLAASQPSGKVVGATGPSGASALGSTASTGAPGSDNGSGATPGSTVTNAASHSSNNTAAIVGGIVGAIAVVIILALIFFALARRRRKAKTAMMSTPFPPATYGTLIIPSSSSEVDLKPVVGFASTSGSMSTSGSTTGSTTNEELQQQVQQLRQMIENLSSAGSTTTRSSTTARSTTTRSSTTARSQYIVQNPQRESTLVPAPMVPVTPGTHDKILHENAALQDQVRALQDMVEELQNRDDSDQLPAYGTLFRS